MGTATLFEFRSILLDPSVNGGMIDVQTTFQHDLLEISITVRRTQIPPHAEEKDVGLEMALFERILLGHGGSSFALFPWINTQARISSRSDTGYTFLSLRSARCFFQA